MGGSSELMSLANDEEILNLIADRLEALEKQWCRHRGVFGPGSEGGIEELALLARRMAARERRMLREETLLQRKRGRRCSGSADEGP